MHRRNLTEKNRRRDGFQKTRVSGLTWRATVDNRRNRRASCKCLFLCTCDEHPVFTDIPATNARWRMG
jgi:hypothetical protein